MAVSREVREQRAAEPKKFGTDSCLSDDQKGELHGFLTEGCEPGAVPWVKRFMAEHNEISTRRTARDRQVSSWDGIVDVLHRLKTERSLRKRHIYHRTTEPARIAEAYRSMSEDEFNSINGAQEWQNTRFIPRIIQSLRLREPVLALDLGCGSGQSSQVLGSQLPPGSTLLGYDICDRLLARAAHRTYRDIVGTPLKACFMNQSIALPLNDALGRRLDARSVGLVHASGVVGHHLTEADVDAMAAEIARVLVPTGSAVLDAGPTMPRANLQEILAAYGFPVWDTLRFVPFASYHVLVFRRGTVM